MEYYLVNGANLAVITLGPERGIPLIIIPGGPGNDHSGYRSLDHILQYSNTVKLIYFDPFGRGKSERALKLDEYTLERDIADIEGLRVAMKLDKISLLGHSYGGVVAQGYAIKYQQNLNRVILISSFHSHVMWQNNNDNCNHAMENNYPELWHTLMRLRARGDISRDASHREIYGKVPYDFSYSRVQTDQKDEDEDEDEDESFNTDLYYQLVGKDGDFTVDNDIGHFDHREQLKGINIPVLAIAGRYDRVATPKFALQYKKYCPQAQFQMFEKSGHNPFVEEPDQFAELVASFIENVPSQFNTKRSKI